MYKETRKTSILFSGGPITQKSYYDNVHNKETHPDAMVEDNVSFTIDCKGCGVETWQQKKNKEINYV